LTHSPAANGLAFQIFPAETILSTDVQRLTPSALAYLGDAVYELYVRRYYLLPPKRPMAYHQEVVAQVRAEAQARHLCALLPYLTEVEQDWLKRGRNTAGHCPKRLDPKIYQQATGLETLLGYLYLTSPQRLLDLLSQLGFDAPSPQLAGQNHPGNPADRE
jgi:ribonuclease III family protein